jgi:outer membrane receptor protein involved in Fe transport
VKVPVLQPATFISYEGGFWMKMFKDKVFVEATVYKSDGKNEIVEVLMDDGSTQNQSVGKTLHQGIEYTVMVKPVPSIQIRLNGSNCFHQYVEFSDVRNDYSGNEMSHAPEFIAHAAIGFRPQKRFKSLRLELEVQKIGAYYIDAKNTEEYDGYAILNARAGYTFKGFEMWMNVMNLTDYQFASRVSKSTYGSPMNPITVYSYSPGFHRTIQFGVTYHFAK